MKNQVRQKSRYALQRLENVIINDVSDFFKHTPDLEHEFIPDFKTVIDEEIQQVKENIRLSPWEFQDPAELRRHIQYHQYSLLTLAGRLLDYTVPALLHEPACPAPADTFPQILYHALEDLLDFTQNLFPEYFDYNTWVPLSYQHIARHHLGHDLDQLRADLLHHGVTLDLVAIAIVPLADFAAGQSPNQVTYRQIAYLQRLKKQLAALPGKHTTDPANQLHKLLYTLNFNSPDYADYCEEYLRHELRRAAQAGTPAIHVLHHHRKLLRQARVTPGLAFDPSAPGLTDTLRIWIDAEIRYAKATQPAPDPAELATLIPPPIPTQISTTLTASELCYIFRLLLDLAFVTKPSQTKIGTILAAVFHTVNDACKPDSYRQLLHRVDVSTKRAVELILMKMLQLVRDDIANNAIE